jgi:3-methylcrotonyl-CoA carboxylase alpha subunit
VIDSLMIANRGEIARRIIRTARRLGIWTIAVYSEADAAMPFVGEADAALAIGPAAARDSYLSVERILDAAKRSGAAAIHPGYGFLSENAEFAEAVLAAGLVWVGAPPAAIRAMGLKDAAKRLMMKAGVPVTPGYIGDNQTAEQLQTEAGRIGYPVLIKAVAGGGGKGMRRVDTPAQFIDALASCRREAAGAFGDDRVLIEKYILKPRHIEVQIFGDTHGNMVHLFERDCSLQRRHQKVIEEAPAPGMDAATREAICATAVNAGKAIGYVGAGTIEFIADASEGLRADRIWFMEMNTRLQVEHAVTEAITGLDLVEWQIRVASAEPLPLSQKDISMSGWAMEARLYAENPSTGFLPSTGRIDHLYFPAGLRVDSGVEAGNDVTPYYDPMIAKLIQHGPNRRSAASGLADACKKIEIWPVKTNAAFLSRILDDADFLAGKIDTDFIARRSAELIATEEPSEAVIAAAAAKRLPDPSGDVWSALTGFRLNAEPVSGVSLRIGNSNRWVSTVSSDDAQGTKVVTMADGQQVLFVEGQAWPFGPPRIETSRSAGGSFDGAVPTPMPGRVIAIEVREGTAVKKGEKLVVLEAMKMEYSLVAPFDGTVGKITVATGAQVSEGTVLVFVEKGAS